MMKKKRRGRVLLAAVILMLLASCRITDVSEGERKELSYAIVKPGDFPPEIDQILRRKKESAFQMAYESGDDLYILRGYGSRKAEAFPYRSKKYRNRKTPFSFGQNSSDLPQRRSRKAPPPALTSC